ncbi:MAG: hypothetical protein ACREJD_07425 [Phycisphaerales bacterium]
MIVMFVFWIVRGTVGVLTSNGLPGHPVSHAMRWLGWPFFDIATEFPGVVRGVPFRPAITPSNWKFVPASVEADDSVWYPILLSVFWPVAYGCAWFVAKGSSFSPRSIGRAFAYSLGWILLAAPLAAANSWRIAITSIGYERPSDLSIRPSYAFDAIWQKTWGIGLPRGWLMLDAITFPFVVCACFGWWWISTACAHGQKRGGQAALFITFSVGVIMAWQMRLSLLLVWLDVKAFFQ